jgi:uncharacterized protein YndB with AHSA1/START domain
MTKETYDLVAEQLLDATDEDVFDAYTDADAGRTVFAGGPDWDVDVACDLRVGACGASEVHHRMGRRTGRRTGSPWSIAPAAWPSSRR